MFFLTSRSRDAFNFIWMSRGARWPLTKLEPLRPGAVGRIL